MDRRFRSISTLLSGAHPPNWWQKTQKSRPKFRRLQMLVFTKQQARYVQINWR